MYKPLVKSNPSMNYLFSLLCFYLAPHEFIRMWLMIKSIPFSAFTLFMVLYDFLMQNFISLWSKIFRTNKLLRTLTDIYDCSVWNVSIQDCSMSKCIPLLIMTNFHNYLRLCLLKLNFLTLPIKSCLILIVWASPFPPSVLETPRDTTSRKYRDIYVECNTNLILICINFRRS